MHARTVPFVWVKSDLELRGFVACSPSLLENLVNQRVQRLLLLCVYYHQYLVLIMWWGVDVEYTRHDLSQPPQHNHHETDVQQPTASVLSRHETMPKSVSITLAWTAWQA